jgi:hypothetical protein
MKEKLGTQLSKQQENKVDIKSFVDVRIEKWFKGKLFTNIPARVMNVDNYESQCVIDVQPIIADIRPEDNLVDKFPLITDVPVLLPSGGGAIVSVPIQVGDIVQLEVNMRNIENWVEGSTDDIILPNDSRMFHLSDCVAKPCLYSKVNNLNPNPNDLELRFMNSIVRLKSDGNITISTGGNIIVEEAINIDITNSGTTTLTSGGLVKVDAANMQITGDLRVDAGISVGNDVVTDLGISHNTHPHTGNLGSATSPPLP